jgi:hypothetical protein
MRAERLVEREQIDVGSESGDVRQAVRCGRDAVDDAGRARG